MSQKITTRVIRSEAEIEEIRPLWTGWQRHPNSDIDFYLMIHKLRPNVVRPHIILLYEDGQPRTMLVGRIERGHVDCSIGYKSLIAPKMQIMSFVHGGLLGDASGEAGDAIVAAIMQTLEAGDADVARLHFLGADSTIFSAMRERVGFLSRDRFPMTQQHWRIELPGTMVELYAGLSGDHRWELKRKSKKLLAEFPAARVECLRKPEQLERIFTDAEQIAKQTYQRGLGAGFIDSAEMRRIVELEIGQGWHRTYLLYINEEPIAFWIGNVYGDTFHSSHLGYLTKYDKYSPGTFVMVKALEEMLAEGLKVVDFGLGDARYKQRFGNFSWEEMSVQIFAPRLRGVAVNALRTPIMGADRMARTILQKTDAMARVKKLWRDYRRKQTTTQPAAKSAPATKPQLAKETVGV
jgi:CelD/BcsL family acetyltransferase involved in cellulose biosynthesis